MAKKEVAFFKTIAGDRDPPKKRVKGCGLLAADVAAKTTGREIVIATNSYRAVRGRSVLVSIFDDCAFW